MSNKNAKYRVKNANGEYIIFLDSDDYLHDNKVLEDLNNLISDEDLIFFNYEMDKYGEISNVLDVDGDIYERIAKSTFLGVPTKCFKKSLIENLKFPECQRYEDIVFTIEAMCKAEKYKYMEKPFFTYRKVLESNSTSKIDIKAMTSIITELLKVYNLCVKYPKYKESLLRRLKWLIVSLLISVMSLMLSLKLKSVQKFEQFLRRILKLLNQQLNDFRRILKLSVKR
jgi:glycosyltransferase involved in cell wall biosynthesis